VSPRLPLNCAPGRLALDFTFTLCRDCGGQDTLEKMLQQRMGWTFNYRRLVIFGL